MQLDAAEVPFDPAVAGSAAAAFVLWGCAVAVSLAVAAVIGGRMRRGLPAVSPRPHAPAGWDGGEVATAVAIFFCLQLLAAAAAPPQDMTSQLAVAATAMLLATAAMAAMLLRTGADPATLGFGLARLREDAALGVASVGLALAPLLGLAAALDSLVPYRHALIDFLTAHRDPLAIGLVWFAAVVAAPISEEFLFRRVLQGWLQQREPQWGRAVPVVLSSLAFALAHVGQGLAWVPLFFFGLVAGYLARQTGSIVPGIVFHGLFNAVSILLVLAQTAPGTAGGG